jgi:hypothetical protein
MRIRGKEGRMDIRGKNALKKSRKKGKTNQKKGKIQSGVAYDPLITKIKTLSFGRFIKQNKKNLQIKKPSNHKKIYIIDLSQSMKKFLLFQHLHLYIFPK